MTTRLSKSQLEQLKAVMLQMMAEASNANWPELSRLDGERRIILNYPEYAGDMGASPMATPAISSGSRPLSLLPSSRRYRTSDVPSVSGNDAEAEQDTPVDDAYRTLCTEILELDTNIKSTIEKARNSLLQESRSIRAQVSAKKGYEQASNMKSHSYS